MYALVYVWLCAIIIFYQRIICIGIYAKMAAARVSSDVLQMFYGPIMGGQNRNMP